jgi:hypothetical protein
MIDYKEHKLPYTSFIGGWYIPENVCDELVETYKNNKSNWVSGKVGLDAREDDKIKKSTELVIYPQDFNKYLDNYFDSLRNVLEKYKEKYPNCSNTVKEWSLYMPVKIQHYMPDEGFKAWHSENDGNGNHKLRHLVFMTYLNSAENAGTEFLNQEIKTPCHKGLTLIWPAGWTHTHRGIINNTQEKTIVTGWYDFHA